MTYNLRRPLSKMLFDKINHQNQHLNASHEEWYSVNMKYLSNVYIEKFLQLYQDDETKEFIEDCFTKSDWFFTQIYHGFAKSILTWFISATSANGLLNRGSMFVLSTAQIGQLLDRHDGKLQGNLLDLGAGDGKITIKFKPFFNEIYATEISSMMQWRLRQKEIKILDIDTWIDYPGYFDVISCLNLLDRCDRPLTMLENIKHKLTPHTGLLLLAIVFPIKQYVENNSDHKATEMLNLASTRIWEVQLNHFIREIIEPAGYQLLRWTRLPYLCEGDFSRSFYSLNDVVLVLKPIS